MVMLYDIIIKGVMVRYIKTMFELNKRYGWSKYIVVVPSIAIREGAKKSFEITEDHFMENYGKKARYLRSTIVKESGEIILSLRYFFEVLMLHRHHCQLVRILSVKTKRTPFGVLRWRRGRDSNPCALSRKLISSQPRYDHFDTSPYMFTLENEGNNHYSIF